MRPWSSAGVCVLLLSGCAKLEPRRPVSIPTRHASATCVAAVAKSLGFTLPAGYRYTAVWASVPRVDTGAGASVWTAGAWLRCSVPSSDPIYLTRIRVGRPMLAEAVRDE